MKTYPLFIRLIGIMAVIFPVSVFAAPDIGWINALAPGRDGALVASERGLFVASPDGNITLRAKREGGFTALAAGPANADVLYASGSSGCLLRSNDGGRRWELASQEGPDSFSILVTGPGVLYGLADALYQSTDGGSHWTRNGATPDKLISLTVSADDSKRLLAGTEAGLLMSDDDGAHWQPVTKDPAQRLPVTLIRSERDGSQFRFDWGKGLQGKGRSARSWTSLNNQFGGQYLLQLVRQGQVLVASTGAAKLFVSRDNGRNWKPLDGYPKPITAAARRGERLFATNCQACHGDHGIGQSPQAGVQLALAPALDETAHAWHHTDEQLVETILHGLPPPSQMVGWTGRLKSSDAQDIVAYMKSMWTERALRCQGPKHMDPDCRS